jgi:hypothetical protein
VSNWITDLTVEQRFELASSKCQRLIDHVSEIVRLHESNRILLYTNAVSSQIPRSYAAHAFNQLQRAQHFFEIARLCAVWDAPGIHRDSIPTVVALVGGELARKEMYARIAASWASDDDFAVQQAEKIVGIVQRVRFLAGCIFGSERLSALKNFRHKFIAHALSKSDAEHRGQVIAAPKYGEERRLLYSTIDIVKGLYLGVANTDFAFDMTVQQAQRNAREFWGACKFQI